MNLEDLTIRQLLAMWNELAGLINEHDSICCEMRVIGDELVRRLRIADSERVDR